MTTQIDIYRTAKLLVDLHGEGALLEAGRRAESLLDSGDLEGRAVSLRELEEIQVLLAGPKGQPLH